MTSNSSSTITDDHGHSVEIAVLALTAFSMVATLVFLLTRFVSKYVIPEGWRLSLILQDVSNLFLGTGLVFFLAYMGTGLHSLCSTAGFFLLFGLLDFTCMLALTAIALLFLQNPGKLGQLSTFKKTWIAVMVVPEKVVVLVLALIPVTPIDYFDTDSPYPVACFPVRQEGGKGAAFGAILFFILWLLEILGLALSILCGFRLWKTNNSRIHASSPNLWQTEKIGQGRALQKMALLEQVCLMVLTFILTIVLYTNRADDLTPQWLVMVAAAAMTVLHACLCAVQLVLWSLVCCCQANQKSKEPYQKLKKLELIKVEGPGKLRLRASWSARRGITKRGLVKVYGLNQLKGWAQEIVVLGMLRKCQNASLLQCLWTANTNPYFETMTMLSGQIVTSEARLICLELTSSGNLQDFLGSLDVPLPEPCTRTILHDLAEGLASLHAQNILHRNLTSAAVYLKGSVQRLVLRAAVGDFEEAQIYGSLQNGTVSSSVSKKHFFLPDVRAFALVALEILAFICKRRQEEKQPHHLISSPTPRPAVDSGRGSRLPGHEEGGKKQRKAGPASTTQFCAPGAADDFNEKNSRAGGRIFVVGTASEVASVDLGQQQQKKRGVMDGDEDVHDHALASPTPFENQYMEVGEYDDEDSGTGGYYPDYMGEEFEEPRLPAITHVREAYKFEFPSQSVFKPQGSKENDYEEIDDIEEEIHREILCNALHRRREAQQTGGYIVTRTTSGRELFIPAQQHNTSFGNSDSGYVGTSSNSSRYRNVAGDAAGGVEDPPDVSWPKAAHRTISANTISSFGDDVLEVLPGMTDEDDLKNGERTLRQMLRDREDANVEQILQEYEQRVRTGGFSQLEKEWPKLKFSRIMGSKGPVTSADRGEAAAGKGGSRPSTPLTPRQQETSSPRPKTAAGGEGAEDKEGREGGGGVKRVDKARPLSASASSAAAWKLRSSFKKNKARNELARALSRGNSFAQGHRLQQVQRGAAGKLIEQKYAAHNAAIKQQGGETGERQGGEDEDEYLEPRTLVPMPGRVENPQHNDDYRAVSRENEVHASQPHQLTTPGRVENPQHNDDYRAVSRENEVHASQPHQLTTPGRVENPQHDDYRAASRENGVHASQPHHLQQNVHIQQQQQDPTVHCSHPKPSGVHVGKFSSFSSSDSSMSYGQPQHKRDTSLTSGELTSLSSQADTSRQPISEGISELPHKQDSAGDFAENKTPVLPGMKLVDSGFDEDSASVVSDVSVNASPNVSGEACTCSCQSGTVTGSETCSCDCSQCQDSHSPRHSGWSESQSSCGTWSNSNSFSSYDVKMHRRKLPSKPKSEPREEHVLGPDEQYPTHPSSLSAKPQSKHAVVSPNQLSPPGRPGHRHHHHHHHHIHHSHSHSGSSTSSSAASRRYRELTKKGVPLRVTAVDDTTSRADQQRSSKQRSSFPGHQGATAEVIEEEEDGPDNALYQDLESQGFFESTDTASNKSQKKRSKRLEMIQGGHPGGVAFNHFSDLPPIPSLEEIIKEIPDETGGSCSGDETKAFLNRPESEVSIKPLKPPAPKPPTDRTPYGKDDVHVMDLHREPRVVHDAELVIDRIFSRAHPANTKGSETFVDPALGLDETAIRKLAMLPPLAESHDHEDTVDDHQADAQGKHQAPLLIGTDSKHVRYVRSLSDKVDLLSSEELLPADARQFGVLRRRLLQAGSFGAIGVQLLDIVGSCWLKEAPPSTADIVDQLTDHVTETEL